MAADAERTLLGLTHNPFLEPQQGFFERGGRKTQLDQLRHLSQWSRRVLLVTGPEGVGKTSIYRELVRTLEPGVKAARIVGSLVNTGREVLAAVATGFGLGPPQNANLQTLRHLLVEHIEGCSEAERSCVALVDDAHLLDHKAVDELVHLVQESPLHLVLFGEVRMVPVLERAASAYGVGWQEIRLTGYGDADARDYLEWRFQQARYRGRVPFTDGEVREMVRLSGGLPGRLNQMANTLLAGLETGEVRRSRSIFPRLHGAVAALLATVVGLLYVIAGDGGPDSGGTAFSGGGSTAEVEVVAPVSAAVEPSTEAEVLRDPSPSVSIADRGEGDPSLEASQADATESVPETTVGASAEVEVAREEESTPDVSAAAAQVELATPEPSTEPPASPPVTVEAAEEMPVSSPPAAEVSTAAPDRAEVVEPVVGGPRDTRWLLAQDPDSFTLQLVTVSALDRAEAFVRKQTTPEDFAIYQLDREGRTLHVVVYGLYASREAAMAAVDRLPSGIGDIRPWVRPLSQVQSAATIASRQ